MKSLRKKIIEEIEKQKVEYELIGNMLVLKSFNLNSKLSLLHTVRTLIQNSGKLKMNNYFSVVFTGVYGCASLDHYVYTGDNGTDDMYSGDFVVYSSNSGELRIYLGDPFFD